MRPEDRDPGYVWDMLDAAQTIRDFTVDVTLTAYLLDRKLQLAVERAIEIKSRPSASDVAKSAIVFRSIKTSSSIK